MTDIDDFFAEQNRRMNIPDEDVDEYVRARLAGRLNNKPTDERIGAMLHCPPDSHQRRSKSGGENNLEGAAKLLQDGSIPLELFPGPPTISASARCIKRRTNAAERSVSTPINYPLESVPGGSNTGPDPVQWIARTGSLDTHDTKDSSADHISISGLGRLRPRSRMTPSNDFTPANNKAVPVTEHIVSTRGGASGSAMESARGCKRRRLDTHPPVTPHYPSPKDAFIPSSVLLRHEAGALISTSFDGHGSGATLHENLSSAGGAPKSTKNVDSAIVTPSCSNTSHESFTNPLPCTPQTFHIAADPNFSNITSPTDTQPSHTRTASRPHATVPVPKGPICLDSDKKSTDRGRGAGPRSGKKGKEKQKLTTPLEYARQLQLNAELQVKSNHLKGKRIFYAGGDMTYASSMTKGRMKYIVKHGGTLVSKYDPASVTHIVTDAGVRSTLQALSLKSLSDIPNNIPTVTWSWVISECNRANKQNQKSMGDAGDRKDAHSAGDHEDENDLFDFDFLHEAFPQRIDAGRSWEHIRRSKQANPGADDVASGANDTYLESGGDISHISAFSQEREPAQTGGRSVPLTVLPPPPLDFKTVDPGKLKGNLREHSVENIDPLAEYYAQARADREARWNQDASDSDDGEDEVDYRRWSAPRRGFTCDTKGGTKPAVCVNQHIVDKLEELKELHKAKSSEDDRWRTYSYGKCIPAIRSYPKPIRSFSEARSIRGVGEKTALKIMEIINTGDLKRIKYENTEDVTSTRIFQGIYGVGRNTAFTWFASGLRTLDDVRARKGGLKLTTAQEIGLKYYDDINSRMPREEARKIFETIKPIALEVDSMLFVEIMGSYRRGKADCGDIDILITRPTDDGETHRGVLQTLLERLRAAGIITEDLAVPDDFSDLELIYRGLCTLREPGAKRRRIDFLCVPWESRGAALLYYTGDDIFNRAMRLKANKHGYSLNQRGMYAGVVRDPHDRQKKLCEGHIVASETEEDIFNILGVPWQEPHERIRG